jgi:hypothetical protein
LEQPGQLAAMRKNALRIARPDAGSMIAGFAVNEKASR